jgi:hypothetical protein
MISILPCRSLYFFDGRRVALKIDILLWWFSGYFYDRIVTLMIVMLLWYLLLWWSPFYLNDHHVTLMVMLLGWSSCHFASTFIQCNVEVSTEFQYKQNRMTGTTAMKQMYRFYTNLKNYKPRSLQKWWTSLKGRVHGWGLNRSTGGPNCWLTACHDLQNTQRLLHYMELIRYTYQREGRVFGVVQN